MLLEHISVSQFRNISNISIKPGTRCNLLYGFNAQGKTNFLEAIYLLGNPRSFRVSKLSECVQIGELKSNIVGTVLSESGVSSIKVILEGAGKKVLIDEKVVQRASEIHGKINVVVFSPDDTAMIKLGPDTRRRYLDRAVYTSSVTYLKYWHDYHRILKQRNQLLKNSDISNLSVWTEKLAEIGAWVVFYRQRYVEQLNFRLKYNYKIISEDNEKVEVIYNSNDLYSQSVDELQNELFRLIESNISSDKKYGTTSVGPHRDDLCFKIDDKLLKSYGSQGQQKSFILALKMAEIEHLHNSFGEYPLLLLDDMSSELDVKRNKNLIDFIIDSPIQVFITTTERATAGSIPIPECAVFQVNEGNLTFEGTY